MELNTSIESLKVLILVMSSKEDYYPELESVQRETWDSIEVDGVTTVYYMAGDNTELVDDVLYIKGSEHFSEMYTRTRLAFEYMLNYEWDYVFKTDNSAYVNKSKLVEVLTDLPRTNLYAGKLFHDKNIVPVNKNFMWGEGYVLSRDLAKYITTQRSGEGMVDDVWIASLLKDKVSFVELPFYDYFNNDRPIENVHLYRCKNKVTSEIIDAMQKIYSMLNETEVVYN